MRRAMVASTRHMCTCFFRTVSMVALHQQYISAFVNNLLMEHVDKDELWRTAMAEIEVSISKANFLTWFKNTSIISRKEGVVLLSVPNAFTKEWLENKYNHLVLRALRNASNDIKEIKFTIGVRPSEAERRKSIHREEEMLEETQLNFTDIVDVDRETNLNPKYTFETFIVGSSNELAHAASLAVTQNLGRAYNPLFIYGGGGLGKT